MAIWVATDLHEGGSIHYEALSVEYYGKVPTWTIRSFPPTAVGVEGKPNIR